MCTIQYWGFQLDIEGWPFEVLLLTPSRNIQIQSHLEARLHGLNTKTLLVHTCHVYTFFFFFLRAAAGFSPQRCLTENLCSANTLHNALTAMLISYA